MENAFNPREHLIQLKSKQGSQDYLPVQWRLVWFREQCPHGTIDTEELEVDLDREVEEEVFVWNNEKRRSEKVVKHARGYARYKAIVTDGMGGRATGTKSENAANFPDFVEKAETGSIGRALAALGYGTQFAPELDEEHRIADSPVSSQPSSQQTEQKQPALEDLVGRTKRRAKALGVAHDAEEWGALLQQLHIAELRTPADIAKVNGHLTMIERQAHDGQHD